MAIRSQWARSEEQHGSAQTFSKLQSSLRDIIQQPQAAELPARRRREKIAVARTRVTLRCRMRAAAQHHLVDHELAVVLAERAVRRAVARVGQIRAARPLPDA